MARKSWLTCGLLLAFAVIMGIQVMPALTVLAASVVGSGSFNLANQNDTQTIYTSTTTPTEVFGITVSVTSGSAQVEDLVSGNWVSLGTVLPGETCVFEAPYTSIRVKALVNSTVGSYSNRGPTTGALGPDFSVGGGIVSLGSGAIRVYSGPSMPWRHVVITAGAGQVALRATSTGADLLTVSPNLIDSLRTQNAEYWLSGSGTVAFSILEDPVADTFMLLPQAHWPDEFSPRSMATDGNLVLGAPSATVPVDELIASRTVWDEENEQYDTIHYVQHEALVTFTPTTSAATIRDLFEDLEADIDSAWFRPDSEHPETNMSWFHVHLRETSAYYNNLSGFLAYLQGLSYVQEASHNDLGEACSAYDSGYRDEYFGSYSGGQYSDSNGRQRELSWLSVQDAWDDKSGSPASFDTGDGITVVVLDSGIQVTMGEGGPPWVDVLHPDLQEKIFKHPKDDLRRGLAYLIGSNIKGWALWPVAGGGGTFGLFNTPSSSNDFRHGTAVAGIIGADTYNGNNEASPIRGKGVAGCGPELTIIPGFLKWKTVGGVGAPVASSVVDAIRTLSLIPTKGNGSLPGVRVVNMSFAYKHAPPGLKGAITNDRTLNGRLYVAAAGDTGTEKKMYPAFWDTIVLGVTGTTNTGIGEASNDAWQGPRGSGSTYWCGGGNGSTPSNYKMSAYWRAYTTDTQGSWGYSGESAPDPDYAYINGTSASAAYVSALAGLIYGRALKEGRLDGESNDVTPDEVTSVLVNNLKSSTISIPTAETKGGNKTKAIPGVVHFKNAKDDL